MITLFDFNVATFGTVLSRFAFLLVILLALFGIITFVLSRITKKRYKEIGFSNWIKVCMMYAIVVDVIALCVSSILTIRYNGLYFFAKDALSWSRYCGYVLMIPEMLFFVTSICSIFLIRNNIKQSLK